MTKGDDIEIDFSKITKWFKKKVNEADEDKHHTPKHEHKGEHKHSEHRHHESKEHEHHKPIKKAKHHDHKKEHKDHKYHDKDEDISIDFKKIGSGIKSAFSSDPKSEKEDEELSVSFDWKKTKDFMTSYQVIFLLLIPLFLTFQFRMMPGDLPVTQQWATDSVNNQIRANIDQQVGAQYPNLPAADRSRLVEEQFETFKEQQGPALDATIAQQADALKARFQDDSGQTYLIAIDPWTFYRQIGNMIERGHVGDEMKDGKPWDNHFLAPVGTEAGASFHHYVGYYWHKLWSIFNPYVSLLTTFFYLPVLLTMLSIIPAFFIARRMGGNVAALFASVLLAIHPAYMSRTTAGFSDTDAYNVLFPLMIAWLFLASMDTEDVKKRYGLSALAGILVGVYYFTWGGWWYIFDFLLATVGLYLLYLLIATKGNFKKTLKESMEPLQATAIFFVSSGLFIGLIGSFHGFFAFIRNPFGFMTIKQAAHSTLWPNVYTTVAELNAASLDSIIGQSGGMMMFVVCLLGVAYILYQAIHKKSTNPMLAILLTLWFAGTMYAATKGIRFVLLLVPAFSIAFGIGASAIYDVVTRQCKRLFSIPSKLSKPTVFLLLLLLLTSVYQAAGHTARNEVPSMTDTWYQSLTYIKDNSEPDAIITSWWDFGHWFKAIADRGVTFDGGSQNTPNAHWVGKSLLTSNEEQAVGILRMLDCGSNNAFKEIQKQNGDDTIASVEALYAIFELDATAAAEELRSRGINDVDAVLANTHCTPPEGFFITSEDMVGKSGVWGHFGSWNFSRSKIVVDRNLPYDEAIDSIELLGYDSEEAAGFYNEVKYLNDAELNNWIAPWPSFAGTPQGCSSQGDGVICGNGLAVNLTNYDALLGVQGGPQPPSRLMYFEDGEVKVKEFNSTVGVGAVLVPTGDSYSAVLANEPLTTGMFTRLFYAEGHGLKYFDKVFDQRTVTGWRVIVWKIDWNGETVNDVYTPKPIVVDEVASNEVVVDEIDEVSDSDELNDSKLAPQVEQSSTAHRTSSVAQDKQSLSGRQNAEGDLSEPVQPEGEDGEQEETEYQGSETGESEE